MKAKVSTSYIQYTVVLNCIDCNEADSNFKYNEYSLKYFL